MCRRTEKKLDLRSGSQRHRHFVGFFNVPVRAPTRDQPFYAVIPTHRPYKSPFTTRWGYGGHILDLTPGPSRGDTSFETYFKSSAGHSLSVYPHLVIDSRIFFLRNFSSGILRWSSLQTKEGQRRSDFVSSGSKIVNHLLRRKYDKVIRGR